MTGRSLHRFACGLIPAFVAAAAGCSAPREESGPGVVHLIPRLEQALAENPPPARPDPVHLLARPEAWTARGGQAMPGPRGLVVRGDPAAPVTLLWSPEGLAIPAERFETLAIDLGLTGAERFEVWCQTAGTNIEEAIVTGRAQPRHAENRAASGAPAPFRIRADRLLESDAEPVDRIAVVVRWTGDADRELVIAQASALATGDRPGIGGPRRERVRLGGDNLETWQMGAGENHRIRVALPEHARLLTSVAALGPREHESFEIALEWEGQEHVVFRQTGDFEESWTSRSIDLSEFAGRTVALEFRTRGGRRAVFAWGAPVVVGARGGRLDAVVWVIDTLREDVLSPYGFPGRTSPSIGRLAREGTMFPDCYSTTSWTRPSMGSLMTSKSALIHGAYLESRSLREDLPTFAEHMQRAGWYTVALITNPNAGRPAGLDRGYDRVLDLPALADALARRQSVRTVDGVTSSGTSERIHAWLDEWLPGMEGVPIFVYAHANDPHRPNAPRAPFKDIPGTSKTSLPNERLRNWAKAYGGDVAAADWFFGRSMRLFEQAGRAGNMIVALMADHGEEFREHGGIGHGTNLWPEQIRIPLVFWGPGLVPADRIAPRRASLLDVQPTLLDLLGVPPLPGAEGRSLVFEWTSPDSVDGVDPPPHYLHLIDQDKRLEHEAVVDSALVGEVALLEGGWKVIVEEYGPGGDQGVHLYDLQADPGEIRDLSTAYPDLARDMATRAVAWWGASRRGAPAGPAAEMDAETVEALRALGYLN